MIINGRFHIAVRLCGTFIRRHTEMTRSEYGELLHRFSALPPMSLSFAGDLQQDS